MQETITPLCRFSSCRLATLGAYVCATLLVSVTEAQINVGSDGSHGMLDAAALDTDMDGVVTIDLATTGNYDSAHWCVVFHYTDVIVQQGIEVRFQNHPSRAPVVWLVQNDVVIDGTLNLTGENSGGAADLAFFAEPGPGGFRGGRGRIQGGSVWNTSSGFGPGGGYQYQNPALSGDYPAGAGSNAIPGNRPSYVPPTPVYNNPGISQLIGGSGGGARRYDFNDSWNWGGGGGGGALLIAANDSLTVLPSGKLVADGGRGICGAFCTGGGAGGSIRLIAHELTVTLGAEVLARGGEGGYRGGDGRIRLEANLLLTEQPTAPPASCGMPVLDGMGNAIEIFPSAGSPSVRIHEIAALPITYDASMPLASLGDDGLPADVPLMQSGLTPVEIRTENLDLAAQVYLRVTRAEGAAVEIPVTHEAGAENPPTNPLMMHPSGEGYVIAMVNLQDGYTALQARVVLP